MSSKIKMALTLTVIGLLSGASIWAVNELTAPVIANNQARAELAIFFEFFPEGDRVESTSIEDGVLDTEYTVFDRSDTVLGYVLRGVSEGYGGAMTVLVALTPSGDIVDVKVTAHSETPNILTPLLRDYVPNLQGQSLREVEYDASTGATSSYRAIQNVVNATRNVFAGDPFIELLNALDIEADAYEVVSPLYNPSLQQELPDVALEIEILLNDTVVAYKVDLLIEEAFVSVFYFNDTFIKVYSETFEPTFIEALNAQSGQPVSALEGDDVLSIAVVEAIHELGTYERLKGHEFIYAKKVTEEGTIYYGTARGFSGQNIFSILVSESGDLIGAETLVLSDTLEYYLDVVAPGIINIINEGIEGQTAPDAFAEATSTGRSFMNIAQEAIAIHGGSNDE